MNRSTYRFTLDLQKHRSQISIAVFVHDSAVRLYISLTDGGNPYQIENGGRAVFYGKRPNDTPLCHNCMIDDTGRIIYDFNDQTAAVAGITNCQIRIYGKDGELITAPRFSIVADERLVTETDIERLDDSALAALDNIQFAEMDRVEAEAARVEAEAARVEAEAARVEAERNRANTEDSRINGEHSRGIAEEQRVTAESARVEAENSRTVSENLRDEAEEKRIANERARIASAEALQTMLENGVLNGKSAYDIAVKNGFEGTEEEWLDYLAASPNQMQPHKKGVFSRTDDVSGWYAIAGTDSPFSTNTSLFKVLVKDNGGNWDEIFFIAGYTQTNRGLIQVLFRNRAATDLISKIGFMQNTGEWPVKLGIEVYTSKDESRQLEIIVLMLESKIDIEGMTKWKLIEVSKATSNVLYNIYNVEVLGDKVKSLGNDVSELQNSIGDIDSALDKLHTYAQNLVNGGATV